MSIDPDVATTDQPYVFTNDDPLNSEDPLGSSSKGAKAAALVAATLINVIALAPIHPATNRGVEAVTEKKVVPGPPEQVRENPDPTEVEITPKETKAVRIVVIVGAAVTFFKAAGSDIFGWSEVIAGAS